MIQNFHDCVEFFLFDPKVSIVGLTIFFNFLTPQELSKK